LPFAVPLSATRALDARRCPRGEEVAKVLIARATVLVLYTTNESKSTERRAAGHGLVACGAAPAMAADPAVSARLAEITRTEITRKR